MNVDVNALPADLAGELLRYLAFNVTEGEVGAYDVFDMRPGWEQIELDDELTAHFGDDVEFFEATPKAHGGAYYNEEEDITCAFYYYGDGTLVFRVGGCLLENTDCKKDHGWRWIK